MALSESVVGVVTKSNVVVSRSARGLNVPP